MNPKTLATLSRAAGCDAAQAEIAAGHEYDGTIPPSPPACDPTWFAVGYLATWLDAALARETA